MAIRSSTTPAPVMDGYPVPEQEAHRDRVRNEMRKLMPVSFNGQDRPRATPDESVIETVVPTAVPSMAAALGAAADAVGADLPTLLDSQAFCAAIGAISPADSAGLQSAILDFQPAPTTPGMKPNPAQGSSGAGRAPAPAAPKTLLERIRQQAEESLNHQPTPPGSTW